MFYHKLKKSQLELPFWRVNDIRGCEMSHIHNSYELTKMEFSSKTLTVL